MTNREQNNSVTTMTLAELKALATERQIAFTSKVKKSELIALLTAEQTAEQTADSNEQTADSNEQTADSKTAKKQSIFEQLLAECEKSSVVAVKRTTASNNTCFINRVSDKKHIVAISGANRCRVFFTAEQNSNEQFTACLENIIDSALAYRKKKGKDFVKQAYLRADKIADFVSALA